MISMVGNVESNAKTEKLVTVAFCGDKRVEGMFGPTGQFWYKERFCGVFWRSDFNKYPQQGRLFPVHFPAPAARSE